jgi:hypothetical protein
MQVANFGRAEAIPLGCEDIVTGLEQQEVKRTLLG